MMLLSLLLRDGRERSGTYDIWEAFAQLAAARDSGQLVAFSVTEVK